MEKRSVDSNKFLSLSRCDSDEDMLYPIGIQNFEKLRKGGYTYVDKTAVIHRLVSSGTCYFLSRPRRFGKSLLLSTLESYLKGEKELFRGLAIESLEKDWKECPVLHLDLSGVTYTDHKRLEEKLCYHLDIWAKEYGVESRYNSPDIRFSALIDDVYNKTGRKVAVLVDEYDKPLIDNLLNKDVHDQCKEILQGFYGVLKLMAGKICFAFLAGVSKIGKLNVFSALNNLHDISMDPEYSAICGITEYELHKYFADGVSELAAANNLSIEQCYEKLKEMYDGYHFSESAVGVYNPFSLLSAFRSKRFNDYWFETGTPTLLVNVMKQTSFDITSLSDRIFAMDYVLDGNQDISFKPVPLFFQTGYLTIKGYDPEYREYRLGFPNDEVKNGFLNFIYSDYIPGGQFKDTTVTATLARAIKSGEPDEFMKTLEALFAGTTYQIQGDAEKDFQYAMYIIIELLGEYVQAEYATSNGRIDLLIQTKDYIYIIELKVDSSPEIALGQIEEKGYAKPFASDSRKLFSIGINFASRTRRIESWKIIERI
jgi:hypothetical protein